MTKIPNLAAPQKINNLPVSYPSQNPTVNVKKVAGWVRYCPSAAIINQPGPSRKNLKLAVL